MFPSDAAGVKWNGWRLFAVESGVGWRRFISGVRLAKESICWLFCCVSSRLEGSIGIRC